MNFIVTKADGIDWLKNNSYKIIYDTALNGNFVDNNYDEAKTVVLDSGIDLLFMNDAYGHAIFSYLWVTKNRKALLAQIKESNQYLFLEGNNEFFDEYKH